MMPCGSGWGFHPKQGLVTLPRFPQPLSAPAWSRVTRPLLRGKMVFNWYICCASFGARWYRIDILAVNILWLYYVDISLSYFPIEFALWANYLSAIWLFVFCSQIVKYIYLQVHTCTYVIPSATVHDIYKRYTHVQLSCATHPATLLGLNIKTIYILWFRLSHAAKQVPRHYLALWRYSSIIHLCVTRPQWVKGIIGMWIILRGILLCYIFWNILPIRNSLRSGDACKR